MAGAEGGSHPTSGGDPQPNGAHKTSHNNTLPPPQITSAITKGHTPTTLDNANLSQNLHATFQLLNGSVHGSVSQPESQPMSYTHSGSSLSSVRDDDMSGPSPYGTRSRNRPGTRPNYSEDLELEYDYSNSKAEGVSVSSKHFAPLEHSGFRAINGTDGNMTQSRPAYARETESSSATATDSPASQDKPDGSAPERKKKRKHEKANAAPRNPSKDTIPGTSHFSAVNSNGSTPEPPPKKRKTTAAGGGEAQAHAVHASVAAVAASSGIATATAATSRKSSASHVTKNGRQNCIVSFDRTKYMLKEGKLEADDGTVYAAEDSVYLVCEPPGEPYYLARIMEFRHAVPDDPSSPVVSMLVNWFYRPKDIQRYSIDPRYLFASMQSDESPVTSLRGKCFIKHRSEIDDLDAYRKERDTFWFNQLYDRYIHRPYEMVPAAAVVNVPEKVKKAIDEKWKFLVVEQARMKELTSAVKLCKRCSRYCAPTDSVDCGVCRNTYHMTCVSPPLVKKPTRGFAWSCGPCSRAQEKKLEARHAAILPEPTAEEDPIEEEEEEVRTVTAKLDQDASQQVNADPQQILNSQLDLSRANMWPWRYLGIHCRVEDVLQYDDRAIYPRATSRLGPRHQANIAMWFGRPVQLTKPPEVRKKWAKGAGNKKDYKLSKDNLATIEAEKQERARRPKWMQDEPPGYVARGEDHPVSDERNTARPLFIMPGDLHATSSSKDSSISAESEETLVDDYMTRAQVLAKEFGLARDVYPGWGADKLASPSKPQSIVPTNYIDHALQLLNKHEYNPDKALSELRTSHSPKDLCNPAPFSKEEMKKFEDGVAKHGSELRLVRKAVKTRPYGEIVRTYYAWKKSEKGQDIWSHHGERRHSRKRAEVSWTDIADNEDDSAFDKEKSAARKRRFQCKFCLTRSSRQWRRAPNVAPGAVVLDDPKGSAKEKANQLVVSLCHRCALMWRKYALRWEDPEEVAKSLAQTGGRAWKRKTDEEILRELVTANEAAGVPTSASVAAAALSIGVIVTILPEPPKKKLKVNLEKESTPATDGESAVKKKEKEKVQPPPPPPPPPPRPPTPPIMPSPPKWKQLPCSVCSDVEVKGDDLLSCKNCRLTVHRRCYAIPEQTNPAKWICDTCLNDKQNELSLDYKCVLCPVNDRRPELVEPPKVTHKKKNDRDREKERLEKKLVDELASSYQRLQTEKGRPAWPREAVKKTASNNWVHIVCAVWTPEIRFSESQRMECADGMATALTTSPRAAAICKICKVIDGGCVSCAHKDCSNTFHVACAHEAGYIFGFDITPVKGSRKDMVGVVTLGGETGSMTAAIWCKEHATSIKTIVHGIHEIDAETNLNALQTFVRKFKQADRTLTGTVRKANMFSPLAKGTSNIAAPINRRASLLINGKESSPLAEVNGAVGPLAEAAIHDCMTCHTESTPQWHQSSVELEWECHKCYIRSKSKALEESPEEMAEDLSSSTHQPDYFELTAPRPIPPQLLGPWSLTSAHSRLHLYPSSDAVHIEQARNDIEQLSITVSNQSGVTKNIEGRRLGRLDDLHLVGWNLLATNLMDIDFDIRRHAIITEDGLTIHDNPTLAEALATCLARSIKEASWRVVDHVPEPGMLPAPPLPANPPSRPQSSSSSGQYPQPPPTTLLRNPPQGLRGPPPPTSFPPPPPPPSRALPPIQAMQQPPPPLPQQAASPYPDAPLNTTRSSPYFSHSPVARSMIPASFATGSTSPPMPRASVVSRRSTTPREQAGQSGGASTSPNLRNLVH